MECRRAEELILTDYIDGNLKGEALGEAEEHLASCERCRKLAGEAAHAGKALKAIKREEPPQGLWYKIRAEILSERTQPDTVRQILNSARYVFTHLRPAVALAAVAILILFVLTAIRLSPPGGTALNATLQDDVLAATSLDDWNGTEYDFGTSAEEYFL